MRKMQKRRKSTFKKVEQDIGSALFDYFQETEENMVAVANMMDVMIEPMMKSAMDLTKLVIENRARNNETIDESEIYEIHKKSFNHCMNDIIG